MKKMLTIILILSLIFVFSACNEDSEQSDRPKMELNDTIDLGEIDAGLRLDDTTAFSYVTYRANSAIRPYFVNNDIFPGNFFIYETNTPHIDDVKLYGYMDQNFESYCNPISLSPNAFALGLTTIDGEDSAYIVNSNFEHVVEVSPGYAMVDNSIIKVTWKEKVPKNVTVISGFDPNSYLVPYPVDTGNFSNEGKIYAYGYVTAEAMMSPDEINDSFFVIPAAFEDARPFFNGLAAVKKDGRWGYIDQNGDVSIDFQYFDAGDFTDSVAFVFNGEVAEQYFPAVGEEPEVRIVTRGYWGLIDVNGNPLTEFDQITHIGDFYDGLSIINYDSRPNGYANIKEWNDEKGYISINQNYMNTSGENMLNKNISSALLEPFNDGITVIPNTGAYYFCDMNFEKIFDSTFSSARNFNDGLAVVRTGRRYKYIDMNGRVAIEGNFLVANDFSNGYAYVVNKFNKPGYVIDKLGNEYLKELNIYSMSKFNDEGYAIAYTIIDLNKETQDKLYYMIHIENLSN